MPKAKQPLTVWLHNEPVAEVEPRGDRIILRYLESAHDRWPVNTPILSCSLLVSRRPQDARAFIDGLLPEGEHRRLLAARERIAAHDTFALAKRYGRDVAGAVQFLAPGDEPNSRGRWSVAPFHDGSLDTAVSSLEDRPLDIDDTSELSLGGMQNKMLLVRLPDGEWGRPERGHPSTHILKRNPDRFPGLVAAEVDALNVARHAGLTPSSATLERLGGYDCLITERFDRVVDGDGLVVARIHHEDSCQALGRAPDRKYEVHHGGGGPELGQIADLLDRYASDAHREWEQLVKLMTYTVIIGNADAHGKNVAFMLGGDGTIRLAPAYDTVPTRLWPRLRSEMAMTVGGTITMDGVGLNAVVSEAHGWGLDAGAAASAAVEIAERMMDAVRTGVIEHDERLAQRIGAIAPKFTDNFE